MEWSRCQSWKTMSSFHTQYITFITIYGATIDEKNQTGRKNLQLKI